MKRLIYIIFAFAALVSCTKTQELTEPSGYPMDISVSFATKAGGSSSTDKEPVINSMRVLIFYGETTTGLNPTTAGNMVFNTFFPFGFETERGTGKYVVSLVNPIVLEQNQCRKYEVYVVLNEEDFFLSGATPVALHTTLGDFEGTETELKAILNTPAVYSEVLKNADEPAFLMSASKEVVFGSGELGSVKPVKIEAGDNNRGRSMAEVVVEKITSEPADGVDYSSTDVPLIFVKSVTLENIPSEIAWSEEDGTLVTATAMTAQTVGAAKTHTDGSGTYYDRTWYGHATRTISNINAQKVQYTDAKFYRTGNNADPDKTKKWSFTVKPYASTATPHVYAYVQGDDVKPALDNDQKKENALAAGGLVDNNTKNLIKTQLAAVMSATQDDNDEMLANVSFTSYEVAGVKEKVTTIGPVILTDEYWTVRLGDKFYVPENIQSSATNATFLRVKLAIAQPVFSFSLNKVNDPKNRVCTEDMDTEAEVSNANYKNGYHYVELSDLPQPSSLPGEDALTYTYYIQDTISNTTIKVDAIDDKWGKTKSRIVWADDESHILTDVPSADKERKKYSDTHSAGYHVYLDGFLRKTDAVQTGIVVNETLKGSVFHWGVPDSDTSTTHVYDFLIPVNNNIDGDGDYSLHRNTRYKVTLYVNAGTYTALSTKADAGMPFTVTAKVTTENVSDYED